MAMMSSGSPPSRLPSIFPTGEDPQRPDIMDAIGDDYAFLPGLDHCCGDSFFFEVNSNEENK